MCRSVSDLTCPTPQSTAIAIPANITAPVLLDLKGHTITGGGFSSTGIGIGGAFAGPIVANAFPITVRNGAIQNVSFGIWAESNQLATVLSAITICDLTLTMVQPPAGNSTCVLYGGYVENSTVRNCTFNHSTYGVLDNLSPDEVENKVYQYRWALRHPVVKDAITKALAKRFR
jgi:hypothetical protein